MRPDEASTAPINHLPLSSIIIPEDRQRKGATADAGLVTSIQRQGLLNPIIVRRSHESEHEFILVAGERRLDAFRQLKHGTIPARLFEMLDPLAIHFIELTENLARNQLSWQEEAEAISVYHVLRLASSPEWSAMGTANDLGFSEGWISQTLTVASALADEEVAGAASLRGAYNLLSARADRTLAAAVARGIISAESVTPTRIPDNATKDERAAILLEDLGASIAGVTNTTTKVLDKFATAAEAGEALRKASELRTPATPEALDRRIQQADFIEWAATYTGEPFDVLHCDFPYGKNYKGSNTRKTGSATAQPTYEDGADIYFALVDALLEAQDRLCYPQAHCLFWFDMIHYTWTVEQFRNAGWHLVQPHPLIWTKGYQGVASDPKRRPRHCYETALLFSRGGRLLRKLDNDHFAEQVDEKLHISQKPQKMLSHFLQLLVDEHTAVLDPTCGSGSALAAADALGADRVLGLELDEGNCDVARFILNRSTNNGTAGN